MIYMKSIIKAAAFSAVLFLCSQIASAQEQKVTIFFTGHVVGNYEPCG